MVILNSSLSSSASTTMAMVSSETQVVRQETVMRIKQQQMLQNGNHDNDDDDDDDVSMHSKETTNDEDEDNSCSDNSDDDSCSSSYSSDGSSDWSDSDDDDDDDDDDDVEMEELMRTLPRLASSPAFFNTNGTMNSSLISNASLQRQTMMRSDSAACLSLNPLDNAPKSLMQRMKVSELVVGNGCRTTTTPSSSSSSSSPKSVMTRSVTPAPVIQAPPKVTTTCVPTKTTTTTTTKSGMKCSNPQELYLQLLQQQSQAKEGTIQPIHVDTMIKDNFFLPITSEMITGYDMAKTIALRTEDITSFRTMIQKGQSLQVCNRFGESIIHSICRRGSNELLTFFISSKENNGANCQLNVIDDYGRNPMHDACWTVTPKFDLIEQLLQICPDLLLITDKRGSSPLDYVRKEHWSLWCNFLTQHQELLVPHTIVL